MNEPQEFDFGIGAVGGGPAATERVYWSPEVSALVGTYRDGRLYVYGCDAESMVQSTASKWDGFWKELDRLGVWDWEGPLAGVLDGTEMVADDCPRDKAPEGGREERLSAFRRGGANRRLLPLPGVGRESLLSLRSSSGTHAGVPSPH